MARCRDRGQFTPGMAPSAPGTERFYWEVMVGAFIGGA